MDLPSTLSRLGLKLPAPPVPVAAYEPAVSTSGRLIFVSGQLPLVDGTVSAVGPVPSAVSVDAARAAARRCVLNALAIVDHQLDGQWARFVRIVRVCVFVASDQGFVDQAQVANGASELLREVFGQAGGHARVAVGVIALPLGATVEVELTVEVR